MDGAMSGVPVTPRRCLARFARAGMPAGGRLSVAGHTNVFAQQEMFIAPE